MAPPPSRSSVHSVLRRRLVAVTLVVGATFAGIAYFTEQARVRESITEIAMLEVGRLEQALTPSLDRIGELDREAFQRELELFSAAAGDSELRDGSFVLARMVAADGRELAEIDDPAHANLAAVRERVDSADFERLREGESFATTVDVGGQTYVGVELPLSDSRGQVVAQILGAFALSDAALGRLRSDVATTIGYVLLVVLATVLALYPIISRLLGHQSHLTLNLLDANLETLQALGSAIAKRDNDTDAHNYRVSVYAVALAEALGLGDAEVRSLIKGALLHDVGKLGIRDNVLLKPGKLDEQEYDVMKTHVEHGLEIASRAQWLADAQDVIGGHHERFDGSGYPAGLAADAIPVNARIFSIVDVFDALTSRRPYKDPFPLARSLEILEEGRGTQFDPQLLDVFETIAKGLHAEFAGHEDDRARRRLGQLTDRYFRRSVAALL